MYKYLVQRKNGFITGSQKQYSEDKNYTPPQGWEVIDASNKEYQDYENNEGDYTEEKIFDRNADYKLKRKEDYADIREQLDMMYWDKVNGTDTWVQHCSSVKTKYPKE